ncbi:hypothetical protein [Methylobacterium sp.]|jgi:hypothetical protein|uniref:hypothetical protein n=1 Tax=Methylobacterium sp. TaxID=409 RepID=UPI00262AF0E4|nr:hypothetical protein [Methylobacterium sp.]MDB5647651.1 hypothetical protein [Methylobacterium sp.]
MPPLPPTSAGPSLDRLATHCIAARSMIDEVGTPVMRRLIDLLLFEIGIALADPAIASNPALEPTE